MKVARPPKFRARNKVYYRVLHWPIWIAVFFLAPGPLVFQLFAYGFSHRVGWWLAMIVLATAIAGWAGQLPGVEPRPYIIRFDEDRPNPLYRKICYTTAWGEMIAYAVLNWLGLLDACVTGKWHLQQIYSAGYFPIAGGVWILGAMGKLPRVKATTRGEGYERRFFYGMLWATAPSQGVLGLLWIVLPRAHWVDFVELGVFTSMLSGLLWLASQGFLPRTLPVIPEFAGQVLVE
jgi:hypothetical protein